jgi:protease PrsW
VTRSPLRRPGIPKVICAALVGILLFATIVNLALLAGFGDDVLSVFDRALARSTALASVPLTVLRFLDRRERESPLLFASAFLWGGCIATGLALPFNTAFLHFADMWVREHPQLRQVLGPDATILLAAPISAPIVEEISKALGVLLIFWLLRAECS